jgi:hypothetical protein
MTAHHDDLFHGRDKSGLEAGDFEKLFAETMKEHSPNQGRTIFRDWAISSCLNRMLRYTPGDDY